MGENRQIAHVEMSHIVYIDTPSLKDVTTPLLGLCTVTAFIRVQYRKRKGKNNFKMDKIVKHCSLTRITSKVINHVDNMM